MREELIEILAMICPTLDFEDEEINIIETMDSMEIASLVEELESKYGIEITEDEKTEENFENLETLIEMIERMQ